MIFSKAGVFERHVNKKPAFSVISFEFSCVVSTIPIVRYYFIEVLSRNDSLGYATSLDMVFKDSETADTTNYDSRICVKVACQSALPLLRINCGGGSTPCVCRTVGHYEALDRLIPFLGGKLLMAIHRTRGAF